MSDFSPEALGATEIREDKKKKKDDFSPEALGASEVSPEALGAVAIEEEPTSQTEAMKQTAEKVKRGDIKLSSEQLDKIRELLKGAPERIQKKQKEVLQAAGYGALQGIPFIGTWTDEMLDKVGVDRNEIQRLLRENPEISTTAEVMTALAIPVPGPSKLSAIKKIAGAAGEAALTSAGAAEEDDRLQAAKIGAGLAGGITGLGTGIAKGISKAGGKVKDVRLAKEAAETSAETLKEPKRLLGLQDELQIPAAVKKAQEKFNIPTEQIEDVAVRYGITENPQNLTRAIVDASKQLDEAYAVIDESVDKPVAEFLDGYMERFRRDAAVTEGPRTIQSIRTAENKLAKAEEDLAELIDKNARSVDIAVMEDRVEKLTDELTATKVQEKMRNIYKSTLKDFNEKADAAQAVGSTSLRDLVDIKNQLFKEAGTNPAKMAVAYDFNNALQEYVEKNAPEHLLGPWKAAKKDWSTLTLIDSHLGKTLAKNYEKVYGLKPGKIGSSEEVAKQIGSMVRAGYALKNLVQHPVLFGAGMTAKSVIGTPLEKAGDLAEKVLQSKKVPSRGLRSLEHILLQRKQEQER